MVLKEDVLKCTTAELGFGLCRFISEEIGRASCRERV